MNKYTELNSLTDVAAVMDAGKKVDRKDRRESPEHKSQWIMCRLKSSAIDLEKNRYRLVEEIEESPELQQGDEIMVWVGECESGAFKRKFAFFYKGKIATEIPMSTSLATWDHWKPVPTEKPSAREGWAPKKAMFASPDEALSLAGWNAKDLVRVREVI